jgi:hypothetical protein
MLTPAAAQGPAQLARHAPGIARQIAPRPNTSHSDISRPHVYLMRGLLNIFSLGMDQLAAQIQKDGIDASVYNHSVADAVVAQIATQYRAGDHGPYILVGHSLGADAVMLMAQSLDAQGVPVALVIPFDGTGSYAAPRNVACVLNLTQRQYAYMQPGLGFHGRLQNVDVSNDAGIDHFTIDKSPRLQAMALASVLQTVRGESCRPGVTGPVVARPKDAPAPSAPAPSVKVLPPVKVSTPTENAAPTVQPGDEG